MERKYIDKLFILLLSLVAGSFTITSCSDWTDDESVDIEQPVSPDYGKYLESLRAYKNSDHKYVYAWFDNSEKTPYSRGQHIYDMPDSVDVVSLIHPESLADFEIREMQSLRSDKGTKVVYTVSYDAVKKAYDQMVKDETENDPAYSAPAFSGYLEGKTGALLALLATYDYDGVIIGYEGQSTAYMSDGDKAAYLANQAAFLNQVATWYDGNKTKMIVFEGNPQFLENKSLLASCKHIILSTLNVSFAGELGIRASEALAAAVPADRFIVAANATAIDASDKKTGYYGDDRAIIEAAYWVTESVAGYTKAGLGIYNIQNDYYNIADVYRYAKQSINIMNPAPTN